MADEAAPLPSETPAPAADAVVVDPAAPPPAMLGTEPPKPAEPAAPPAPAAPVVPEKYEAPAVEVDGKPVPLDAEALAAFETTARDAGLTQEQFAAVTKAGAERIAELAARPYRAWADQQRAWQAEINADPEIGGDKLAPSLAHAAKALDAFGGDALRHSLVRTGAGNDPEVVRAFVRIGKAMGDPTGLSTGKPAVGVKARHPEQAARDFYNAAGGNYPEFAG